MSQGTSGYAGAGGGWGAHLAGDLVSGEAVLLELRIARFPSRALARLIDLAIQLALVFALVFLLAQADIGDSAAAAVVTLLLYIALLVGYPLAFETLTQGRTPGKMVLGLRVVRDDGGSTRVRHALVRALLGVLEVWILPFVAILTSLVSTRGKRVGDYLAGTVVVRERVPQSSVPYVQMPPALAAWATGLELSRLPDQLALAARQLLGRASDISPQARAQMAERIAVDVSHFVAPPPPPGCPPEAYLAAVLAERRRREIARTTAAPAYGAAPSYGAVASAPSQPAPPASQVQAQADPYGFHPPA